MDSVCLFIRIVQMDPNGHALGQHAADFEFARVAADSEFGRIYFQL